ncbi:MAG: hypothetical protein IJL26_05385, partial [Clostridia bacterium]|nr:hypothetical protein [Clostridia bacterium]
SFTGIRRTAKANCALAAAGIVFTAACAILSAVTKAISGFDGAVISCAPSFGWPLQAAAFAVFFAANLLVLKKGLPVLPAEGMRERVEIAKKVRRGELRLDDLPQPVVETAETRKIEEQIRAAKTEYEEKRQKREAEAHEKA